MQGQRRINASQHHRDRDSFRSFADGDADSIAVSHRIGRVGDAELVELSCGVLCGERRRMDGREGHQRQPHNNALQHDSLHTHLQRTGRIRSRDNHHKGDSRSNGLIDGNPGGDCRRRECNASLVYRKRFVMHG
jgi:hypothetical protein